MEHLVKYIEHWYTPLSRFSAELHDKVISNAFGEITVSGLENIAPYTIHMPRKDPNEPSVVYCSRHRSESDFTLILAKLAKANRYAITQGGDNLFIAWLDSYMRRKGAYKMLRFDIDDEKKTFYSHEWKRDLFHRLVSKLTPFGREPVTIDRKTAGELTRMYNQLLFQDGYDQLWFAEVVPRPDKVKVVGRSKTGMLNEFSPLLFRMAIQASRATGRPLLVVPVSLCYERVPEDRNMYTIAKIKDLLGKKGHFVAYGYDFAYHLALCLPLVSALFRREKPKVALRFGKPIEVTLAHYKPAMVERRYIAREANRQVGQLETIYPTQLIAYSALEELIKDDWKDKVYRVFHRNEKYELPAEFTIAMTELDEKCQKNYEIINGKGFTLDGLVGADQKPIPLQTALQRMDKLFSSVFGNKVFEYDEHRLRIKDMRCFTQYANHILHAFE